MRSKNLDRPLMLVPKSNQHISGSSYLCKIYLCGVKSLPGTCYCKTHTSPLRTNKELYVPGSAPVIKKKYAETNNR